MHRTMSARPMPWSNTAFRIPGPSRLCDWAPNQEPRHRMAINRQEIHKYNMMHNEDNPSKNGWLFVYTEPIIGGAIVPKVAQIEAKLTHWWLISGRFKMRKAVHFKLLDAQLLGVHQSCQSTNMTNWGKKTEHFWRLGWLLWRRQDCCFVGKKHGWCFNAPLNQLVIVRSVRKQLPLQAKPEKCCEVMRCTSVLYTRWTYLIGSKDSEQKQEILQNQIKEVPQTPFYPESMARLANIHSVGRASNHKGTLCLTYSQRYNVPDP